jgi:hypothetical protein
MTLNLIERIGDWNPQLLRELKGRLKPRNVLLAIGLALLAQFLLVEFFRGQLTGASMIFQYCRLTEPDPVSDATMCLTDALGNPIVDWQRWWQDLFRVMTRGIAILLVVSGVYLLISDLNQEESRGTLNFIRLSPQSSRTILLGKLLGTPILLYLAVLLFIPLHLRAAAGAGVPAIFLLSFYLLLAANCYLLYSAALLGGFLGKGRSVANLQMSIGIVLLGGIFAIKGLPLIFWWNLETVWSPFQDYLVESRWSPSPNLQWFYLPLSQNLLISHTFVLLNVGLLSHWVWQALQRCFHSPSATFLSKRQSYSLVTYAGVLMLGFCLQQWKNSPSSLSVMAAVCTVTLMLFLVMIAMLSNHRQTLVDWARYRHVEAGKLREQGKAPRLSAKLRDLLWGEKSPAVEAIALNLILTAAIFVPWILFGPADHNKELALLGLAMTLSLIAVYAAIVQLMLLMKTSKRALWAAGTLALAILLPTVLGVILLYNNTTIDLANRLLLFSPFLWVSLSQSSINLLTLYLSLMGQWLIFGTLMLNLNRQLNRLGESASKSLLTSR